VYISGCYCKCCTFFLWRLENTYGVRRACVQCSACTAVITSRVDSCSGRYWPIRTRRDIVKTERVYSSVQTPPPPCFTAQNVSKIAFLSIRITPLSSWFPVSVSWSYFLSAGSSSLCKKMAQTLFWSFSFVLPRVSLALHENEQRNWDPNVFGLKGNDTLWQFLL
jgi:hypothetical protein